MSPIQTKSKPVMPKVTLVAFAILAPTRSAQQLSIGVGPIDFPDYLRRQEVVTRTAPNRIDVSQANRWAGPIDKNFTRVLSENLAALLSTQRVENYPWSRSTLVDYQVV